MLIEVETPEDTHEVEMLFDLAFAPGRTALSSYRLRDGVAPVSELCLVARDDPGGPLGGAIRCWPVCVAEVPALLLGPIAVHPIRQGEGVGARLIEAALARAHGWDRVLLVGDLPYYARFGFQRLRGIVMPSPTNPDRVLGRNLTQGAWDGIQGEVTKACASAVHTA